jgi:hypothetical protein
MAEKKMSLKKSEAKAMAAKLIKEWVINELEDEAVMDELLQKANLTESGERKLTEAFGDLLAVVMKKAKVS